MVVVVVVVVAVVVAVVGMVVRGAAVCTGGAMDMPVAVLVLLRMVVLVFLAAAVAATGAVNVTLFTTRAPVIMFMIMFMIVVVIVVMGTRLRAARCGDLAVRVLAGLRRRVGDGGRIRIVRIGAARSGAAGMTVSWVVGTLGVGHDNLLNG
nr:hypothetical protein [Burkholderia lata]